MRRLIYIIIGVIVLGGVSASCENRSVTEQLEELDMLMRVSPDSVYAVLYSMDTRNMTKHQRMRHALLRADAQNKAYIDFTTDSVMKEVVKYFDHHGNANEQMRAHYLLGCTYRDLQDVPMELQCFQEAVEKADTTKTDCDLYTLVSIFGQMADIYYGQYLPNEEFKVLEMCEKIAMLHGDTLSAIKSYELKMRPYLLLNEPDSVLSVTKNARKRYLEVGMRSHAAMQLIPAVSILIDREQTEKAQYYLDIFEKEADIFEENGNIKHKHIGYLYEKGRLHILKGEYDYAKECFYKLLSAHKMEGGCKGLLNVYEKTNQIDSIVKYSKMYTAYNDSSFIGVHREVIEQMTAEYNYSRIQKDKEQVSYQLAVSKSRLALVSNFLLLCIISGVVIICMINRSRKKAIKKIIALNKIIDRDTKTLDILKKQQQKDDNLYNRLLKDNLVKSEELELLKEEFFNTKRMREHEICLLNNELRSLQEQLSEMSQNARMASFFEDEIYTIFNTCGATGTIKIKSSDWSLLISKFGNVFAKYYDFILQGNSLTQDQIRVCILLRLGFKEADMANIMDKNGVQINKIKTQINKKLFGQIDARSLKTNLKKHF